MEHNLQCSGGYAAPEVLKTYEEPDRPELKERVDKQAQDAYSLGCVLLWLLTGHHVFNISPGECRRQLGECQSRGLTDDKLYLNASKEVRAATVSSISANLVDCAVFTHSLCIDAAFSRIKWLLWLDKRRIASFTTSGC